MKAIGEFKPGEKYNHTQLGRVKIIGREEGTVTKLIVESIDRGPGFDKKTESFKGVKRTFIKNGEVCSNWNRGENREFGTQHVVHKKDLS